MSVAIVTDSTCDLSVDVVRAGGITVVPMTVTFEDGETWTRAHVDHAELDRRMEGAEQLPTTSQPSEPAFLEAWERAAADGHDEIVSVHVSSALSGTAGRARSLARTAPLPVHVVDSRQVSAGLALQVLVAARAARAGADAADVVASTARVGDATTSVLGLDTIAYLRRGGRLTGPQAVIGTALRVRPVLRIVDGRMALADRARSWRRVVERMVEIVVAAAGQEPLDVVVAHGTGHPRGPEVVAALRERLAIDVVGEVVFGPVVATHTGPGAIGVAAVPSRLT